MLQEILPKLYTFTGMIVGRVYLTQDPDGLTLIDASIPPAGPWILKQLAKAGHAPSDIKRILITHAHPDHVGGLKVVQEASGAVVMASEPERLVIEEGQMIVRPDPASLPASRRWLRLPDTTFPPVPVGRVLSDGEMIGEVLGGLQVLHTPGHALGHLAFWQAEKKLLFCGDTIFRLPHLRLPFSVATVDMAENKRSIARLLALKPELVCFGHGAPLRDMNRLQAFARKHGIVS